MIAPYQTPTLMVQGTTSDAGKSIIACGLCRLLCRSGYRVHPFKPQNMALNSAVATDGGEVGRAQALQAQAARVPLQSDFNPLLLKPTGERCSQVIVQGHAIGTMDAQTLHQNKKRLLPYVMQSYARVCENCDVVIAEGAGSPAEINLRQHDLANMGFAEKANCPVLLVADIERGGVFAQIAGTLELLSKSERARVCGILVNRFRGDRSILQPGLAWLEQRYGIPVVGVIPYLSQLHLDAEDSLARIQTVKAQARLNVGIIAYPRISNHTDFEALDAHSEVMIHYLKQPETAQGMDLLILPGSKCVYDDLSWLLQRGWKEALLRHLRYGGRVLGICGGLQMLGEVIEDPHRVESAHERFEGLGLLKLSTRLEPRKALKNVEGHLSDPQHTPVRGYEIHVGTSYGAALRRPFAQLSSRADGAVSEDDMIRATYVHGVFDHPDAAAKLLQWCGLAHAQGVDKEALREAQINRIANTLQQHLQQGWLEGTLGFKRANTPEPEQRNKIVQL